MKTVNKIAAQGDFLIFRIDEIPADVVPFHADREGKYIVAHSETGHNHTMVADPTVKAYKEAKVTRDEDIWRLFFDNTEGDKEIIHERSFDTHETISVPPGKYEVRRQREYVAEGFRRAQD